MAGVKSKLRQVITPVPDADPLLGTASALVRYLASFAMTAVATTVAVGVESKLTIPNLSLVFVVPVVIAGVSLGLGPSLCSAILGALAFNFFLTEPRYSLAVDDPANVWAIGLLFVVGLHREWRCLHLPPEGDRGSTLKKAGDGAARLQP